MRYTFGSVLWLLVYTILPHPPDQNIANVWADIKTVYKQLKQCVQFSILKLSMIIKKKDAGPKLRGKAAQIKCLAKPILKVWMDSVQHSTDDVHKKVTAVLKLNLQIEDTISLHRDLYSLPASVHSKFTNNVFAMLQLQVDLANTFANIEEYRTVKLFNMTQKSHFLAHIALLSVYINPCRTWCYRGEDFMKVCRTLLENCVKGLGQKEVGFKIFQHYRAGLHLNFTALKG